MKRDSCKIASVVIVLMLVVWVLKLGGVFRSSEKAVRGESSFVHSLVDGVSGVFRDAVQGEGDQSWRLFEELMGGE